MAVNAVALVGQNVILVHDKEVGYAAAGGNGQGAVSYTHLDVYKRQVVKEPTYKI